MSRRVITYISLSSLRSSCSLLALSECWIGSNSTSSEILHFQSCRRAYIQQEPWHRMCPCTTLTELHSAMVTIWFARRLRLQSRRNFGSKVAYRPGPVLHHVFWWLWVVPVSLSLIDLGTTLLILHFHRNYFSKVSVHHPWRKESALNRSTLIVLCSIASPLNGNFWIRLP